MEPAVHFKQQLDSLLVSCTFLNDSFIACACSQYDRPADVPQDRTGFMWMRYAVLDLTTPASWRLLPTLFIIC